MLSMDAFIRNAFLNEFTLFEWESICSENTRFPSLYYQLWIEQLYDSLKNYERIVIVTWWVYKSKTIYCGVRLINALGELWEWRRWSSMESVMTKEKSSYCAYSLQIVFKGKPVDDIKNELSLAMVKFPMELGAVKTIPKTSALSSSVIWLSTKASGIYQQAV